MMIKPQEIKEDKIMSLFKQNVKKIKIMNSNEAEAKEIINKEYER